MIRYWAIVLIASASVSSAVGGGKPVASVKGAGPLQVSGAHVPATAASSSIPLVPGDVVHTSNAPASISFAGNSRVTLGSDSAVKVQSTTAGPAVQLLKGTVTYNVTAAAPVTLVVGQQSVNVAGKAGAASATQGLINNLASTGGSQAVTALCSVCFCDNKPPKRSSHCPEDHGNELGDTGGGNTNAPHDCRIDKDERDHNPVP